MHSEQREYVINQSQVEICEIIVWYYMISWSKHAYHDKIILNMSTYFTRDPMHQLWHKLQ